MKKMLKALITGLVLAALTAGFCVPVMAEAEAAPAAGNIKKLEHVGVNFDFDSVYDSTEYDTQLDEYGIIRRTPFLAVAEIIYFMIPKDEMIEMDNKLLDASDEEKQTLQTYVQSSALPLAYIVCSDLTDEKELKLALFEQDVDNVVCTETGTVDSYHFYALIPSYGDAFKNAENAGEEALDTDFGADIEKVQETLLKALSEAEYYKPHDELGDTVGTVIQFESVDLDGNTVKSGDLFKDNKITMINVWGSWCINCLNEMEALEAMHKRLLEKGCGIVGIEYEYENRDVWEERARGILKEYGITYPSVLMPENHEIFDIVHQYPTTFFVDSEGKILTAPIAGARVDEYEKTFDRLFAGEEAEAVPESGDAAESTPESGDAAEAAPDNGGAVENTENKYRVIVRDDEGNPVEGAFIQLCDDVSCQFQKTDADGVASFETDEQKAYEVHVRQAPEGYAPDENVYKTLETYSDVNISLQKAA